MVFMDCLPHMIQAVRMVLQTPEFAKLTGTFLFGCTLYRSRAAGLPVTSRNRRNALDSQKTRKPNMVVPENATKLEGIN